MSKFIIFRSKQDIKIGDLIHLTQNDDGSLESPELMLVGKDVTHVEPIQ